MRNTIAREMEHGPAQDSQRTGTHRGTRRGAACHMQRDDHAGVVTRHRQRVNDHALLARRLEFLNDRETRVRRASRSRV
jgi:hypothetical protein